jgi:hypothetical protein
MASRTFVDSTGRTWMAWGVYPYSSDRRQLARRAEIEGLDGEREGVEPRSGVDRRVDSTRADAPDRRSGAERRQEQQRRSELDRRSGTDRREAPRVKARLPGDYAAGWLCFASGGEKRRLAPLPPDWDRADDATLDEWLRAAESAHGPRDLARSLPFSPS